MKNKKKNIRLSRRIFFYLLIIATLSVFSVSFFWFEYELNKHKKEIKELRNNYSQSKKLEIKNKILEVKDYIQWIQEKPLVPLSTTLKGEFIRIKSTTKKKYSSFNTKLNLITQPVKEAIDSSRVPIYIIDNKGAIEYSNNPFIKGKTQNYNQKILALVKQIKAKEKDQKGIVALYRSFEYRDSVLTAVGYFDRTIIPDHCIISIVTSGYYKDALQVHILDSISRIQFKNSEYIFINTYTGKALLADGKYNKTPIDIYYSKKSNWIEVFQTQQTSADKPEGVFYTYDWLNLTTGEKSSKTSYFSYVPGWDWIIGTGFHEDDIGSVIKLKTKSLKADLYNILFKALIYLSISTIICYIFVIFFTKRFKNNVRVFNDFFDKAAKNNVSIDHSKVSYSEFKYLVDSANHMVEERKQVEDALIENEKKYHTLFEFANDSILIMDNEFFIDCNEYTVEIFGCSNKEEIINHSPIEFSPEFQPDGSKSDIKALSFIDRALKGKGQRFYWKHKRKDNSEFDAEVSLNRFELNGKYIVQAIVRDITENRKAQELLKKSEERYRLISNVASDYMFTSLIDDKGHLKLNWVAGAFENITGYNYEEYNSIGGWRATIHPDDKKIDEQDFEKLKNNIKVKTEIRTYAKNGDIVWVKVYAQPLWDNKENKLIGIYGAVQDITERKEAEEKIKKLNEELELRVKKRTAELESFSYSISHDLRAPLRAIYGFSQILASRHRESLNEEGKQYMDYVVESSIRMEQLINDLLNYSRLGRSSLDIKTISLGDIILSVYADYEMEIKATGGKFQIIGQLPNVEADETLLRQIFINLLGNAVKYKRNDIPLEILIKTDLNEKGNLISVSDNGIGIPREHFEKIFNVFQRLHSEDKYPGTGIGLASVKKAVDMMEGTIWVESELDKGSTFYIQLKKNINK